MFWEVWRPTSFLRCIIHPPRDPCGGLPMTSCSDSPAERKIICSMSSFSASVTTHVPKIAAGLSQRILPEGTPVSLISVEDWSSKTAENGGPIAFMLASDIQVDGVIVAPIGSKAWGHASFAGGDGKAMQVGLDSVRLKVGDTDVPLRSTPLRDGGARIGVSSPRKLRQDRHRAVRGRECHALRRHGERRSICAGRRVPDPDNELPFLLHTFRLGG